MINAKRSTGPYNFHFVGGRRHYHRLRQFAAAKRRHEVARLMLDDLPQKEIAARLGVSRVTIWRDQQAIGALFGGHRCKFCKHVYSWSALFRGTCLDFTN